MSTTDCETRGNVIAKEYWELADIAAHYGVSKRTVQRWVRCGLLPQPFMLGRKRLWMPGQVIEWMDRKCREAQTTASAQNINNFMIPRRGRARRIDGVASKG